MPYEIDEIANNIINNNKCPLCEREGLRLSECRPAREVVPLGHNKDDELFDVADGRMTPICHICWEGFWAITLKTVSSGRLQERLYIN